MERASTVAGAQANGAGWFFHGISDERTEATNLKSWAIRFWFLLTVLWVIGLYHVRHEELCAANYWHSAKDISDHLNLTQKELARPKVAAATRNMLLMDHDAFIAPYPVVRCAFVAASEKNARQNGGYTINWSRRLPSLALLVLPPLIIFLLGIMLRPLAKLS